MEYSHPPEKTILFPIRSHTYPRATTCRILQSKSRTATPNISVQTKFDPYWRDASESLMTGLIHYVMMTELYPTMEKVIDSFYKLKIEEDGRGISTSLDSQFAILNRKDPESIAARKLRSFCQLPFTTGSCVRDDSEKAIQNMFPASDSVCYERGRVCQLRGFRHGTHCDLHYHKPCQNGTVRIRRDLMFSLAIRRLTEFAETQENSRLPRNVKLFFDDFSCGFPIMNYEKSSDIQSGRNQQYDAMPIPLTA